MRKRNMQQQQMQMPQMQQQQMQMPQMQQQTQIAPQMLSNVIVPQSNFDCDSIGGAGMLCCVQRRCFDEMRL